MEKQLKNKRKYALSDQGELIDSVIDRIDSQAVARMVRARLAVLPPRVMKTVYAVYGDCFSLEKKSNKQYAQENGIPTQYVSNMLREFRRTVLFPDTALMRYIMRDKRYRKLLLTYRYNNYSYDEFCREYERTMRRYAQDRADREHTLRVEAAITRSMQERNEQFKRIRKKARHDPFLKDTNFDDPAVQDFLTKYLKWQYNIDYIPLKRGDFVWPPHEDYPLVLTE